MAQKKKNNELTQFEEQFINVYIKMNNNGRLAYKSLKPEVTNESADTLSSKLLSSIKVQEYLEMKREEIRQKEQIELSWLVQQLKNIILEEYSVEVDKDGEGEILRIKTKSNYQAKLQALQQLAKIAGFETKKVDITTNGDNINNITLKDLIKFNDDNSQEDNS